VLSNTTTSNSTFKLAFLSKIPVSGYAQLFLCSIYPLLKCRSSPYTVDMRLLQLDEHSDFSPTKDLINEIPLYAILSHTWEEEHEEITFGDLIKDSGRSKTGTVGYKKIKLCSDQAARDGLRYFWVDPCCIDKSNNTELAEAINSMFQWYRNAAKCYVYLSDVSAGKHSLSSQPL
jgi:hypothetical protein